MHTPDLPDIQPPPKMVRIVPEQPHTTPTACKHGNSPGQKLYTFTRALPHDKHSHVLFHTNSQDTPRTVRVTVGESQWEPTHNPLWAPPGVRTNLQSLANLLQCTTPQNSRLKQNSYTSSFQTLSPNHKPQPHIVARDAECQYPAMYVAIAHPGWGSPRLTPTPCLCDSTAQVHPCQQNHPHPAPKKWGTFLLLRVQVQPSTETVLTQT